MSNKIVSVGGTGQVVLHYYLQLYLLGIIKHEFDVVVVDSDEILPSIQAVRSFFKELQYGAQKNEALGKIRIPTIEVVPVRPKGGDTALEVLTGVKNWKKPDPHPVHALFSKDSLTQELKKGLFARPALSSVLSQDVLLEDILKPQTDSTVIILGAVTGGTGGGLTAPILDAIHSFAKSERAKDVSIRAVLFGEYFRPSSGVLKQDVVRFQSNQTMVLRAICEAEASIDLHSYSIIGGPEFKGDFERHQYEREGKHLAWPKDDQNPFWQGVLALEHLLTETKAEKHVDFTDREVDRLSTHFTLKNAQLRLRKALGMISLVRKKNAVVRMCRDPWARLIWGGGILKILAHYWTIAAVREGGKESVPNFPEVCQQALETLWRGEDDSLGLQDIFPPLTERKRMRPGKMARINWPYITEGAFDRRLFDDSEQTARRLAGTILFKILREVE